MLKQQIRAIMINGTGIIDEEFLNTSKTRYKEK